VLSNHAAHYINDFFVRNGKSIDDVYAYTFATPNNTYYSKEFVNGYTNIFNIVSKDDIVPSVPLSAWGFGRYGNTYYLPGYSSPLARDMLKTLSKEIAPNQVNEYSRLYTSNGDIFQIWSEQQEACEILEDLLYDTLGSRDNMNANYQELIRKIIILWQESDSLPDVEAELHDIEYYYITELVISLLEDIVTAGIREPLK